MSFLDRLRECRYISPSGIEFRLMFDSLERSGGKKAPVHELPHRDVADVQDLGNTAEKFPLAVYFTGADYDQQADAFYAALREPGRGKLLHPRWGDRDVLPLSRSQTEPFVDGIRVARFQVDFIEAPDPATLTVNMTTAAAIQSAATVAAAASEVALGAQIETLDAVETVKLKGAVEDSVEAAMVPLRRAAVDDEDIRSQFAAAQREINREIDTLAVVPVTLTGKLLDLVRLPAGIESAITGKVKAYAAHLAKQCEDIVGKTLGPIMAYVCMIVAGIIGLAECTTTGTIASREEAMDIYDTLTDSAEDGLTAINGTLEDPTAAASLRQLVSDARARLLVESYSLPTERSMVLQGDATPIDLAYQLYHDPEQYQRVIDENGLTDERIFVIPAGTEIRWYE